jgi:renal tumor antigen
VIGVQDSNLPCQRLIPIAMCFVLPEYRLISKKGEGTFSEVIKAQSLKNSNYVAIKCMKNQFESIEQVNNLREIQALRRLSPHSNIVRLLEVL